MDAKISAELTDKLAGLIRSIPDFPKPGIVFRDITPLLAEPGGLAAAAEAMAKPFANSKIDLVVGAESRGFLFGTTIAMQLGCGFIPVRKPGKLPAETLEESYSLEYGTDSLQIHADAIAGGEKVLLVDDLLATGGTMKACCNLVTRLGGTIVGISFLVELAFLAGRKQLADYDVRAVVSYDSE